MPENPLDYKPSRSMDEAAQGLLKLFSEPNVDYGACRYWQYDPNRQVFYRDPALIEIEKMLDRELGIEHHDEDDAPRPSA
jgi:hypothetical protein